MNHPLKKLLSTLRGNVEEIGNAVLGNKALRLLDEDIRQTDLALHRTRLEADAAKARRIHAEDVASKGQAKLREQEAVVATHLTDGKPGLARRAAQKVVEIEAALREARRILTECQLTEQQFNHAIEQLEQQLRRLRHQSDTLKAAESLKLAQASVAMRQPGSAPYPEPAQASVRRKKAAAPQAARPKPQPPPSVPTIEDVLSRVDKRTPARPAKPRRTAPTPKPRKEGK